ncbi:hypothetical protein Pla123a_23600 [Posidoniimonas polymericola]|uniref:DUF1552 domain-containing protein n=1 Tax=Posidoniimonas polymericola TaxID=2528002 RepID=A0A5C5YPV8_9BACT|nr:DUF1552 domain-containing protein [Posidoniimonas polymericola]TWT76935.1 hypothetical protein Pla123a_23600 [Posidoniimonas polymericola]
MTPLSRRTFLHGVGATLGLPWLEAMASSTAAPTGGLPVCMAWVFAPNGVAGEFWTPEGEGREFKFNKTTAALEPVRDDVLMISNLAHHYARANGDGPGDHARCAATYLTAAQAKKTGGADIYLGESVDQVAARHIGRDTRMPSLELGLEPNQKNGRCDSGYSCAYVSNVSWRSPTQPSGKEISPRRAFERLFGGGADAPEVAERLERRQSVLDFVSGDAQRLRGQLGQTDRRKIDEYFQSVREVEKRIEKTVEMPPLEVPENGVPKEDPEGLGERMRLMYEVIALAFQTDATRVATYMLANAGTNRAYEAIGVRSGHHQITHDRGEEAAKQMQQIDAYLLDEFRQFVERLASIREGEGRLLDRCAIVYGSGIGDGRRHNHDRLPCVVAGQAGGAIATGRHLKLQGETPAANLFVSMLQAANAPVPAFGDSTGPLAGLRA